MGIALSLFKLCHSERNEESHRTLGKIPHCVRNDSAMI
jgi:hypothetical protein